MIKLLDPHPLISDLFISDLMNRSAAAEGKKEGERVMDHGSIVPVSQSVSQTFYVNAASSLNKPPVFMNFNVPH